MRTNVAYSYARQEYPSYAPEFTPGSASATFLNSQMQQGIINLIWSPFATLRNGTVDTGWLDAGLEYIYTRRDVFGGTAATVPAGPASASPIGFSASQPSGSDRTWDSRRAVWMVIVYV